jgi:hypothetical protein
MRKNVLFTGIVLVLIGAWFYFSINAFETDSTTFPSQLIIDQGTERLESEVAQALSEEAGFDLEGAYKSGYTPMDVINYLMNEPHSLSITHYKGRFYEGRRTISRFIPVTVCIVITIAGVITTCLAFRKKTKE